MKNIDTLEHGGGYFHVHIDGETLDMPDPREKHYQWVLMVLRAEHVPDEYELTMPGWKADVVFERWCAAWDLPAFDDARRLAYLVDNYRASLSSDLLTFSNLDLGELWRARRWQTLLDVIDRLPSHSWYSATVAKDEEHARMIAESIAARGPGAAAEDSGPSLTSWTPEVAVLTDVLDAINQVRYAVVAVQAGKKAGDPPKSSPRPITALARAFKKAENDRRKSAHESLVARVLPRKAPVKSTS